MNRVHVDREPADTVLHDGQEIFALAKEWLSSRRWAGMKAVDPEKISLMEHAAWEFSPLGFLHWFIFTNPAPKTSFTKKMCVVLASPRGNLLEPPLLEDHSLVLEFPTTSISLVEAEYLPAYWHAILTTPSAETALEFQHHAPDFRNHVREHFEAPARCQIHPLGEGDTTNVVLRARVADKEFVFKCYRSARPHSREMQVRQYLQRARFPSVSKLHCSGRVRVVESTYPAYLISNYESGYSDAGGLVWNDALAELQKPIDAPLTASPAVVNPLEDLASVIASLHVVLREDLNPPFTADPVSKTHLREWTATMTHFLEQVREKVAEQVPGWLRDLVLTACDVVDPGALFARFEGEMAQVVHEDLHFGQIMFNPAISGPRRFMLLDFEGDPQVPFKGDFTKFPVHKDLAGLVRALSYIKVHAVERVLSERKVPSGKSSLDLVSWLIARARDIVDDLENPPGGLGSIEEEGAFQSWIALARRATVWEAGIRRVILEGYGSKIVRQADFDARLHAFLVDRVVKELTYELTYRPRAALVPAIGFVELVGSEISRA